MASQASFDDLYRENKDRVYRLCRSYLGPVPEVDDLFQEIFLRIWQHLADFRGEAQTSTWVYRVAVNTALLWRKRQSRRTHREMPTDKLPQISVETEMEEDVSPRLELLFRALRSLKDLDRLIIGLVLDGLSYQEIAEVTGLKANHIGVKVNRIRKKLKQKMEGYSRGNG